VEVTEAPANFGGYGGGSRFDRVAPFGSTYDTPGWRRAQGRTQGGGSSGSGGFSESGPAYDTGPGARRRGGPLLIEGELVAKSTGADSAFDAGSRVFHVKFGNGTVAAVDGNKLTIDFDKAGRKMVLDSFVKAV
jgi:DNA helicase-2/ATP-dependent DNA helicase PcrA